MDVLETNTHSFVIKIWLEETVEESGTTVWRGRITSVSTGERRYIKDINETSSFIWPYLEQWGVYPE